MEFQSSEEILVGLGLVPGFYRLIFRSEATQVLSAFKWNNSSQFLKPRVFRKDGIESSKDSDLYCKRSAASSTSFQPSEHISINLFVYKPTSEDAILS